MDDANQLAQIVILAQTQNPEAQFSLFHKLPEIALDIIFSYLIPEINLINLRYGIRIVDELAPKIELTSKFIFSICTKQKAADKLLRFVCRAQQNTAELVLRAHPAAANLRGKAFDENLNPWHATALQYALWAGDWHMSEMIMQYMPQADIDQQVDELRQNGMAHFGSHYDFLAFLEAYKNFSDCAEACSIDNKVRAELLRRWDIICHKQTKVPLHVMQRLFRNDFTLLGVETIDLANERDFTRPEKMTFHTCDRQLPKEYTPNQGRGSEGFYRATSPWRPHYWGSSFTPIRSQNEGDRGAVPEWATLEYKHMRHLVTVIEEKRAWAKLNTPKIEIICCPLSGDTLFQAQFVVKVGTQFYKTQEFIPYLLQLHASYLQAQRDLPPLVVAGFPLVTPQGEELPEIIKAELHKCKNIGDPKHWKVYADFPAVIARLSTESKDEFLAVYKEYRNPSSLKY